MRVRAVVLLAAMPLLLGGWTLSSENHKPWNPRGKAVVKTPDGVSHVIRSSFCSFGPNGLEGQIVGWATTRSIDYSHAVLWTLER